MRRRLTRAEAFALMEGYADEALGTTATTLPSALAQAEGRLNRAARRALGARGHQHGLGRMDTRTKK